MPSSDTQKKSTSNFQHFMETNLLRPWKLTWNLKRMVSKISFSRGPFSGSMLVFGEVTPKSPNVGFGGEKCWGTRTGHRRHFPRPIAGGIASNLTHPTSDYVECWPRQAVGVATNGCSNPSNWGRGDLQSSTFSNNLVFFGGKMILVMEMSHVCNESQTFFWEPMGYASC